MSYRHQLSLHTSSTGQHLGLPKAKFSGHHLLPLLPVRCLSVIVQLHSITSAEKECCSVLVDQTSCWLNLAAWHPLTLAIRGGWQEVTRVHLRAWGLAEDVSPGLQGQNFARFSTLLTVTATLFFLCQLLSLFGKASGTKSQFINYSTSQSLQILL